MNIKDYLCISRHLLLAITLHPTNEKLNFLYLCSQPLLNPHFPKFKSRRSLGEKTLLLFHFQIDIAFDPTNTSLKMILERQKSEAWSKNSNSQNIY